MRDSCNQITRSTSRATRRRHKRNAQTQRINSQTQYINAAAQKRRHTHHDKTQHATTHTIIPQKHNEYMSICSSGRTTTRNATHATHAYSASSITFLCPLSLSLSYLSGKYCCGLLHLLYIALSKHLFTSSLLPPSIPPLSLTPLFLPIIYKIQNRRNSLKF